MDVADVPGRIAAAAQHQSNFGGLVLSPDVLRHVTTQRENLSTVPALVGEEAVVESTTFLPGAPFLRQEPWTVPLLAASCVNAAAIVAFEVYVLVRAAHGTPSRRHLFLGQCLLLGLLLCSLCGLPLALQPSTVACTALRLSVSIAPALVFGTLLVKCVFLISLNSGVYLPAHYQALLLFFVVLVQVSISIQWLAAVPATVLTFSKKVADSSSSADAAVMAAVCSHTYEQTLLSLVYVMMLILAVAVLAIKCRGYRENYRESSYIGASVGVVIPLWLGWIICGLVLPVQMQAACIGGGMITTSTVVFVIMFIPKGRQMAAVGRDGLYRDDREDRLSTVSDARYSPSFFLFKPVKSAKETPRQHFNSFYKSPPSGMFGYGILPPHHGLSMHPHTSSCSPMSAVSFSAHVRSPPYSALHHKPSIYASLHSPMDSSCHTPPYAGLRKGRSSYGRRQRKTSPIQRQCTSVYWPQTKLTAPNHIYKASASRPGEPVYLASLMGNWMITINWILFSACSSGPSSDCAEGGRSDEALYSTIGRPLPNLPKLIPTSNPNFYLFRSHSHTGMFY
ncbi:GPCR family 3 C-terminal protein [Trinorchestia longiramus]|nr:GPCR family 3 C-terminal protein [Trinorchestia longiramus]